LLIKSLVRVLPQDLAQAHEKMDFYKVPTAHQYRELYTFGRLHLVDKKAHGLKKKKTREYFCRLKKVKKMKSWRWRKNASTSVN